MSKESLVTALVSNWGDKDRPFKAQIIVDGHCVQKSYHVTRQSAFVWASEKKAEKLKELRNE